MIRVIKVLNPFLPGTERYTVEIAWHDGMMLQGALLAAGLEPDKSVAVIGGMGIPPDLAPGFPVDDAVDIIVMPYVGGGGFLKTFAELAVVIAAAAATWYVGGIGGLALAAAAGDTLAAGALSLVGAAVTLAGNLLISAFMPAGGGGQDTATYDPTGPKTVASGGTPIPKGYGNMRWGGNIIASYVDAEAGDNYLNVLVCFGWGPAGNISDIRLNNTSIYDYKDVTYMVRLGSNDQTPIPYFNNIVNGYPQAVRCIAGEPVVVQGTGVATQGLEVVCQFPQGVFFQNQDGSFRSLSLAYKVEYAVSGSNNWQTAIMPRTTADVVIYNSDGSVSNETPTWVVVPTDTGFSTGIVYATDFGSHTPGDPWNGTETVVYYNADGSSYNGSIYLQGEWQRLDPGLAQQRVTDWYSGYEIFTDENQATLYHTTKISNLPANKYDIRVTKYGSAFAGDAIQPREGNSSVAGDQIWIHSVNEVQYQDLSYPNMILLGIRALATNQLSGNGLNVTAIIEHGTSAAIPADLAGFGGDNPAIVAYDMMCSDAAMYGGGISPSKVSISDLVAWANFNDEIVSDGAGGQIKRHVFNGVFEQSGANLWKCLQKVGSMSQCIPVQTGQNYGFIIDTAVDVPAQIFTVGNIKKDSIKDTWISFDDRCNSIEATFADAARDYRTDEPCSVMTPSDIQAGVTVQTTRVNLLGCTSRAQAWHWCYRKLLSTKALTLTRSFDVALDGVACQIGSVIGVQDDITQWADGGRIQAGSTQSTLVVDRDDLQYVDGAGWTVSVLHPVVGRAVGTVQTVIGNQLTFAVGLTPDRIMRCVTSSGVEHAVLKYSPTTVMLDSAAGINAGDTLTFWDEDVIDTQLVAGYDGTTITTANPFIQAPTPDCPWVYGLSAGAFPAKLFRVTSIKRKGDFDMTIGCIIYDPSVYSDDTPIITETVGVPDVSAAVTSLNLTENYSTANGGNGGQQSTISVGWQNGQGTSYTELWIAQNDPNQPLSAEKLLATVSKGSTYTFPAPTGAIVQIRAVGVDVAGTTASWNNAPIATITVQGSGIAPGDVTGFNGNFQAGTTTFTWNPAASAANYEIRYNSDPSNSTWETGILLWSGNATTWADATIRGGLYLIKSLTSASVESVNAAGFSLQGSSSYLNALGLAPSQSISVTIETNTIVNGTVLVTLYFPQQALSRSDGSTVVMPDRIISWSNMAPSTTYYIYLRLRLSDMTMHSVAGDPPALPATSPDPVLALQTASDGYWQGPSIALTTPNATTDSGGTAQGGGSGGGGTCPDGRELVRTLERGDVPVSTVQAGEHLLGRDGNGGDCWKRVVRITKAQATAWYLVNGYRMSPLDPVWFEGEWRLPYEVGALDIGEGERVLIQVDATEYDSQNYFLVGRGNPLLIHNYINPTLDQPC